MEKETSDPKSASPASFRQQNHRRQTESLPPSSSTAGRDLTPDGSIASIASSGSSSSSPTLHMAAIASPETTPPADVMHDGEKPGQLPVPAGGLVAWLSVLAAFCSYVNSWGIAGSYGAFQFFYETSLLSDQSSSTISWIGGMQAFLLVWVGTVAGALFDRGYLRSMMIAGNFFVVFGVMMTSLGTEYWQIFLSHGVCFGLGSGLLYVPAIALVATSFPMAQRPIALGLASTGSSIGGIIFPLMFRRLQPDIGFPWTVRSIGFISLALALISLAIILPQEKHQVDPSGPRRSLFDYRALKDLSFGLFCVVMFVAFLAFWIPFVFGPQYAQDALGVSPDLAFYGVCVLNAGSFAGRVLPGIFMLRFSPHPLAGPAPVFTAAIAFTVVILLAWIAVASLAGFFVLLVAFGFCAGVLVSVPPALTTHPVLTPSLAVAGTRLGMSWAFTGVSMLVGSPIAGALIGKGADSDEGRRAWLAPQLFAGVGMAVALVIMSQPFLAVWRYDWSQRKTTRTKRDGDEADA